jgi:hypothetical protein
MSKKNTIKINNGLTGKVREIALPGRAEKKPAPTQTTPKQEATSGKNKR